MARDEYGDGLVKPAVAVGIVVGVLYLLMRRGGSTAPFIAIGPQQKSVCQFALSADGISQNGVMIDTIGTAVEVCRAAGATEARIKVSGSAIIGYMKKLRDTLLTAGYFVTELTPENGIWVERGYFPARPIGER